MVGGLVYLYLGCIVWNRRRSSISLHQKRGSYNPPDIPFSVFNDQFISSVLDIVLFQQKAKKIGRTENLF